MTVSVQTTYNVFTANGVTTVFPYQFKILAAGDLDVYVAGVLKTLNVDYSVSGVGVDVGGSVTFLLGAPAAASAVSLIRSMTPQRTTDYQQLGDFLTPVVNPDFDNAILLIQDLNTQLGRSIRTPADEVGTLPTLPSIATRAGRFMGFDALGQPTPLSGTGNDSALRTDLASTISGADGARLVGYRRTEAGSVARSVFAKLLEGETVLDFGADDTGVLDSAAKFTNAMAANKRCVVPPGNYRLDSTITIPEGQALILSKGAVLTRGGAATTPMVVVLGKETELRGGTIFTANASPNGVVVLGHPNTTTDMDAWWWKFTDCNVSCRVNQAGDIAVYVPSGQINFGLRANYFGLIQNINIHGGDIQLYMAEMANAHNIDNVQFWNGKTAGLRLRGAYANNVSNMFFHQSAANGYIAVNLQNKVAAGATNDSTFNQITNWTTETTGALDQSLVLESNCFFNAITGGSNVLGGWTIGNQNNHIVLNGALLAIPGVTSIGNYAGVDATFSGKLTVGNAIQAAVTPTTGITSGAGAAAGAAVTIIPSALLSVSKATMVLVNIVNTSTNGNLSRTDLLLLNMRNSGHSASTVTLVSSAFTSTGTNGEPVTPTYTLSFADGAALPKLQLAIASLGGPQTFTAEPTFVKV